MKRRQMLITACLMAVGMVASIVPAQVATAQAGATIKVGILHSLSGTMAISETTLKDTILMLIEAQNKKRWVLEGTDYVYPRTTNKILEAYLLSKGVAAADISINYTPFGHSDWQTRVAAIKKFGATGKKTAVVSTINGDANVPFYKELGNQKISAEEDRKSV